MRVLVILSALVLAGCAKPPQPMLTIEERCLALVGPPGDAAYDSCIEQLK